MVYICRLLILFWLLVECLAEYKAAPYAEWAHSHVVWLNGAQQNQQKIYALLQDYLQHDIPVGGVNIDSDWSNCFNNFQFNRTKFPNPQKLVKDFHEKGVKVILWATSLVNTDCPQYQQGKKNGYFLNKGKTIKWWHGTGAFIDFFNPNAKKWWQSMMDKVINMGFDGWKCDGTDPLIFQLRPWPYSSQIKRYLTYQQYAHEYYGVFYNYTKSKNPNALIMSRPVDSFNNQLFLAYSPKYVMFSGWVGDQNNDVQGFKAAMINIIHSASRGYLNFGFDIGGYKSRGPTQKFLFIRWAQVGALLPFMQNGGGGMHQPWLFDEETVNIYRKFVNIHYDLKQFFLTAGTQAFSHKTSVIGPLIPDTHTIEFKNPSNLGYVLSNTFLVSPIFEESGYVEVIFPKGHKWLYYFNHSKIFNGTGIVQSMGIKIDEAALFIRSNSTIPLRGQLWLVHLERGNHAKTIIAGDYSDDVQISYFSDQLTIQVNRYYKNDQIKQIRSQQNTIKIRLVGVLHKPIVMMSQKESKYQELTSTEYQNQFYIQVPLHKQVVLSAVYFCQQIPLINTQTML